MVYNNLFNEKKMEEFISFYDDSLVINSPDEDPICNWIQKLNNNELEDEKKNYANFLMIILDKLLGYKVDDINFESDIGDEGRPVEFTFKKGEKEYVVVELKGTKTEDLNKRYNRGQSAIEQVTNYASIKEETQWAFVSNYNEFRLFNPNYREKYISFKFKSLTDPEVLKKFLLIFSKFSLIDEDIPQTLLKETRIIERELEDEFYQLFSETRLMLIKELEYSSEDIDRVEAIRLAQLILNRYIFICFAEDLKLLPSETTADVLITPIEKKNLFEFTMWDRLNELFRFMDKGNEIRGIGAFNGGLFKENLRNLEIRDFIEDLHFYDDCYKKWKFEEKYDEMTNLLGDYKDKLNPIYKNLLVISSFDFGSELSVNILGHIFENSIGDIEELKDQTKERRKKDGVFYTPEYITDYICRNTIIPYLSQSGEASTVHELISEYEQDNSLDELDKKLKEIKIVDPACGSGAFLNKAVDVLFEIHEALHDSMYAYDNSLDQYFDSLESRRQIISDNIYGVDLNEESVEITKLSLFLKLATSSGIKKGFKLPNLDINIKCGNSLIDDEEVARDKAFRWKEEFKEILENGGFDIVVGNPPYIRVQEMDYEIIDYLTNNFDFAYNKLDMSILFFEVANRIIKKKGNIGFITSNMFLTSEYGQKIREFLLEDIQILKILDFGDLNVFQDVLTYVDIFILKKDLPSDFKYVFLKDFKNLDNLDFEIIGLDSLDSKSFNLKNSSLINTFSKINKFPKLKDGIGKCHYGIKTGLDKVFLFDDIDEKVLNKELFLKWVVANDCKRFCVCSASKNVLYPYKNNEGKMELYSLEELKRDYFLTYVYLMENKEYLIQRKDSRKKMDGESWYKLIRPGNVDVFNSEKILFPAISKNHKFCLGEIGEGYSGGSVFSITANNRDISLKYLLCIFNSKLIESYLQSITPLKKGNYHSYSSNVIDNVPIPKIPIDEQESFLISCDKILELNENFDKEILSFQKWLKRTFEIDKLPKKLENYYELDFEEFLQEVKKKKVDITQRKTQDLLEKEFNASLEIIEPLQREIKETDDKINQLVYELYELTEEEINIIEESLK